MKPIQTLLDACGILSPGMQQAIVVAAAMVAGLGPLIYIFSQLNMVIFTVIHGMAKLLPSIARVSTEVAIMALNDPNFAGKIIQVGDAFYSSSRHLRTYTDDLVALGTASQETIAETFAELTRSVEAKEFSQFIDDRNEAIEELIENMRPVDPKNTSARNVQRVAATQNVDRQLAQLAGAEAAGEVIGDSLDEPSRKVRGLGDLFSGLASAIRHPIRAVKDLGESIGKLFKGGGAGGIAKMSLDMSKFAKGTVIIGVIIAAVIMAFKGLKKHWNTFYETIKPGLSNLKNAWDGLWSAIKDLGNAFKPILDGFKGMDDAAAGNKAAGFWKMMGTLVRAVIEIISQAIDMIAMIVRIITPPITAIATLIGETLELAAGFISQFVELISAIVEGDWSAVWDLALEIVINTFHSISEVVELAFDSILLGLRYIIQGIEGASGVLSDIVAFFNPFGGSGFDGVVEDIQGAADAIDRIRAGSFSDNIFGDYSWNADMTEEAADSAADRWGDENRWSNAGEEAGDATRRGFRRRGPGGDDGEEDANEWLGSWLGAVQNALQGLMNDLRDQAMSALEEKFEKDLAVFDRRIEAIEEIEKAEERRMARMEYRQRRHQMLQDRALQYENYARNRALAIYEGRIDDARMMDLEEQRNKRDHQRNLKDLDQERRRAIIQQQRDEEKERINIQKEAAQERQELLKESLERQLDLIMRYAPRTRAEFQRMLDGMSSALWRAGVVDWPAAGRTGMGMYAQAIQRANEDLRQQAAWSGNNAATAWLAAFVAGDVKAGLMAAGADEPPSISSIRGGRGNRGGRGGRGGGGGVNGAGAPAYNPGQGHGGRFHTGGKVPGISKKDVPATLQSGEYVIKRDAVKNVGTGFLDAVNQTPTFHAGGPVGMGNPQQTIRKGGKDFITDLTAAWMFDQVAIAGLTSRVVAYLFESLGGRVGGKTMMDIMPTGQWRNIDEFARWIISLPQFRGINYGGTPDTGGMARPQNPSSDHPRGFAADFGTNWTNNFDPKLERLFQFLGAGGKAGTLPTKYAIYYDRDISANTGWNARGPTSSYDRHLNHVHLSVLDTIAQFGAAMGGGRPTGHGLKEMAYNALDNPPWRWNAAREWPSLDQLVTHESSWNPNAQNPNSTAYGLFQFLDSTWAGVGARKTSDPWGQIIAGFNYIKGRYGSPSGAWGFWQRNHWYHKGGLVPMMAGGEIPFNNYPALLHKGEIVLPKPISENITKMADGNGTMGSTVNIYADTFVGDFDHFKKNMERYDVEIKPRKAMAAGTTVRRVTSRGAC